MATITQSTVEVVLITSPDIVGPDKQPDLASIDAASPAHLMEENTSTTAAMQTQDPVNTANTSPLSDGAVPAPEETGAFPTCTGISKREEIRKRLREKERALTKLISEKGAHVSCNSSIEEDSQGSATPKVVTFGKEEADRREAIRVLSQTALSITLKLKSQKEESNSLRHEVKSLSNSLKEGADHKLELEQEVCRLRNENESAQQKLALMLKAMGEHKSMRDLADDGADDKGIQLQNELASAYEEVMWTEKNAVSRNEQLEYCEYQLLAKNQEIDDLKQELHSKTRRIVELEVDLEMHDDRFLSAIGEIQTVKSAAATLTTSGGDNSSPPNELILDRTRVWQKERQKRGLRGIMAWRKKKGIERQSFGSLSVSEELPPPSEVSRTKADAKTLEARYRKERYHNRMQISQLQQDNNEYLVKIVALEKSLQAAHAKEDSQSAHTKQESQSAHDTTLHTADWQEGNPLAVDAVHSEFRPERPPCQTRFLEERIERLDSEKVLQATTIEKLRMEIEAMKVDAERAKRRSEQVAHHCLLECDAQELKLVALEEDLKEMTHQNGTQRPNKNLYVDAAAGLEAKLLDAVSEVVKLRAAQEVKDQKIAKLKTEVTRLRYARMLSEKAKGIGSQEHARDASVTSPPQTDGNSTYSASSLNVAPKSFTALF